MEKKTNRGVWAVKKREEFKKGIERERKERGMEDRRWRKSENERERGEGREKGMALKKAEERV